MYSRVIGKENLFKDVEMGKIDRNLQQEITLKLIIFKTPSLLATSPSLHSKPE
jgi:hypothetical protein